MDSVGEICSRRKNSIDGVISDMEDLKKFFQEEELESLLPFLRAYLRITKKVAERSRNGAFNHPEDLEELDIRFAELYFDAVDKYLTDGEKKPPWRKYFEYTERNDSKPVLELVLGINAHINSDLAQTLHEKNYTNREDFQKIDRILAESLIPVLTELGFSRKDPGCLGILGLQPVSWLGLRKILNWRELTWENSQTEEDFSIYKVRKATEKNAERMISIRHDQKISDLGSKPGKILETQVKI